MRSVVLRSEDAICGRRQIGEADQPPMLVPYVIGWVVLLVEPRRR